MACEIFNITLAAVSPPILTILEKRVAQSRRR